MIEAITKPHTGYRHEAFLYDGLEDYLGMLVPFVADGVEAGQSVMVAVPTERSTSLRAALEMKLDDDRLAEIRFVDMTELGGNPAHILPAWQEFVAEYAHAGRPLRGVGEPVWAERRREELDECRLHEALLNVAIDPDVPFWLRCPYDVESLGPEVLADVRHSHPVLVDQEHYRGSTAYDGVQHVASVFEAELPEPGVPVQRLVFGRSSLRAAREMVASHAAAAALSPERAERLAMASHELVTNSILHGGGSGELRIWRDPGALVCEVRDAGRIADPMAGRSCPEPTQEGGRGLWLVHHLCDLAQVRRTPRGTVVRIHSWI